MKISHLSLALMLGASVFFTACGSKTPSCDDSDVTGLVTDILKGELAKYAGLSKKDLDKIKLSYDGFITEETDEKAKKVFCKAQGHASYPNGKKNSEFFQYSAQYTDDGQIYVEVYEK